MGYRRIRKIDQTNPPDLDGIRHESPVTELDLHGKTVPQARTAARSFITTSARKHPGRVVRIITGCGEHSLGAPKLGAALESELLHLSSYVAESVLDLDHGSYLIRLR